MLVFELEEQRKYLQYLQLFISVHAPSFLITHAGDVKKLQDAGIYACNRMKSFTEIKRLAEAKAVCWRNQFVISSTKCALSRPDHIVPIAKRFGIDAGAFLDNMFYACACMYEHQYNLLLGLAAKKSQEPFRLLVVDSVIALFRVDFTGRELAESQQKLSQMMSLLMNIPKEFNIAVYMTNSAIEVVPEVIADPGKGVFNGADARIGRQVSAGTVGDTSGIDGGGAGPGGSTGTDGGVSGPGGGVAGGAGTGGGVGAGGDGGGGGGGGDDDDGDVAAADDDDDDDNDDDDDDEEEEEGGAALLDNIPPNQDVLARIGAMRLYVKEFEAMVKGDEFQTEVLNFAADRNLLPHLLEGQQLDNIPNLRRHFLERTDFIKEALNIVETNIEFSDEEMELPTDEDFLVAEEIMVFAQAKGHVTDRAP